MFFKIGAVAFVIGVAAVAVLGGAVIAAEPMAAGHCKPISQRNQDVGCWILSDEPIGAISQPQTFWHLHVFRSREAANRARTRRGTVVAAFGRIWLLTIERADWRPERGQHVATIGPLTVKAGTPYSAQYMEGILDPGMTSAIHKHSGPEAWYTLAGKACLETPRGARTGRAGGPFLIVEGNVPMLLSATGKVRRRAFALVLHETARPAITVVRDWAAKGLCKV